MLQKTPVFGHTCVDIFSKSSEVIHDLKNYTKISKGSPRWPPKIGGFENPPYVKNAYFCVYSENIEYYYT